MKKLLLEGGVGGHLNHLYDNRQMTANKMISILKKASNGELIGTEKADGYNIFLGYQGGVARAARNKTDMRRGGMTMEELAAREFKGGEKVRQAYIQSFNAYQAALDSLTDKEKIKIFGPNGEIFYNTEIMGPAAAQVINYDIDVLSIHSGGHKTYNRDTDTVEIIDAAEASKYLDRAVDRFEQATAGQRFSVQRTAFVKLNALDGDADLNVAIARLQKAGYSGAMTIEEYLEMKLTPAVEAALPYFDRRIKQEIIDRILNKENKKGLAQITKGFPKEQKAAVSDLVLNQSKNLIKDAIWPIEEAVHDFAVEMLRGMESAYILDNAKELERLRQEVTTAIREIQAYRGPGEEEAKDILLQQLKKLKQLDDVSSTMEGFVFEEDGMLYKFTGNYAPINQILGLFKYGRGSTPALKRQELTEQDEAEEETPEQFTSPNSPEEVTANDAQILDNIAIFPGGFKPPHKGHFEAAAYLSNQRGVDQVYVIISPKARAEHEYDLRIEVTAEQSKELWDLYAAANRDKIGAPIITIIGKTVTPVTDAYEFMKKMNPGQTVTFAKGSKDKKDKRFNGAQAWSDKKGYGLTVKLIDTPVFGQGISGTMMRKHIAKEDWRSFIDNTPLEKDQDKLRAWQIVTGKIQPSPQAGPVLEETIYKMVREALTEKEGRGVGDRIRGVMQSDPVKSVMGKVDKAAWAGSKTTSRGKLGKMSIAPKEINTIGDLRKLMKVMKASKAGKAGAKRAISALGGGALFQAIDGVRKISDLYQKMYNAQDNFLTGTGMDALNVDDNVAKIIDDRVEDAFLKYLMVKMKNASDDEPLPNATKMIQGYLKNTFGGWSVAPGQSASFTMAREGKNRSLNEVESEKQRRWACAQMGDDFKGERKLTKKQAKEMCKSEVEESEEIEEMSAMGAGAVAGPGTAQKKKKSLIREEDPTIDEVLNYLLNDLGVITNAN